MTQEQQVNIFALTNDHHKNVLFYEVVHENTETFNEEKLVTHLKENQHIHTFYIVNQKRNLIVVSKDRSHLTEIQDHIKKLEGFQLNQTQLPYADFNSVLVSEVTDNQLKRLSKDKSTALKLIESQTGLKLKKQKKTFYFTGLLYQFTLLNELLSKCPEIIEETKNEPTTATEIDKSKDDSASTTQQQENIQLVGLKEDLNKFYELNNKYIKVDDGPYGDKVSWIIGAINQENESSDQYPPNQFKQKESSDFAKHASNFKSQITATPLTITFNDTQRAVKSEPLIRAFNSKDGLMCYMCQNEDGENLVKCTTQNCSTAFCNQCLVKYKRNTKTNNCPNCKANFEFPTGKSHGNGFTLGSLKIDMINEACAGFERFKTYQLVYTCDDGKQGNNHPEPGKPFRGTTKAWFLPTVPEAKEITRLFQKAFHNGHLFLLEFSKKTHQYQIHINPNIILKTELYGGGKFSYPDPNYVRDIYKTLKQLLNEQ